MPRSAGTGRQEERLAHLAAIVENSDDAIYGQDLDGTIMTWNTGAERLYGYSAEEAIGRSVSMLLPEHQAGEALAVIDRVRTGERVPPYDTVHLTRDGRGLDVSLTVSPVKDCEGRVTGVAAVARDVTQRRRAEQAVAWALRDHERLQEVSCRIIPADNAQTLYEELIEAAIDITQADRGTLQRFDSESGELVLLEARGMPDKVWETYRRLPADAGTSCALALQRGERVIVDYLTDDRVAGTDHARIHLQAGIRAAQSTPLVSRSGGLLGMISTHWDHAQPILRWQLQLLDVLARQAADLIERTHAESAARASEERERLRSQQLQTLLKKAPLGVYFVDADFRLQEVNPTAKPIFADFPGGAVGRDFAEILHAMWDEERAVELVRIFRRTLETGEPHHAQEFTEVRADLGVREYYDWRTERIVLPDGRYGVVCYFREIADETRARLAVAQSEERYRALFSTMDEGFCVLELIFDGDDAPLDYRFIETNPAFERHTGLTAARGKRALELVPGLERHWLDLYGRVALTGEPQRFVQHSPAMGRWFEGEAFRQGDPEQRRIALLFTDITERKQAEDALRESEQRLILAKSAAGLGIHDFNVATGEIGWDRRTRDLWGVGEDETVTYETWLAGVHPDDRDSAQAAVRSSLDPAGNGTYFAEFRVNNLRDGTLRWIQVTGKAAFEQGQPIRLVGTVQDVTERRQAEEALREADRHKDEFLATLAHELRNPLAAIRTAISVLGGAESDPGLLREMKAIIERQSSQLVRLINDLMDVNRISRGRINLERQTFDAADVMRQVVADWHREHEQKELHVSCVLPDRPIPVEADPMRLAQVLNNLLQNAYKFTPRGGRVKVTLEQDGETVVLRVSDTGIGLTEEQRSRIFDMFAQVADSPERRAGGLGIGLSLARSIVELHGGILEARSEGPGKGSEFTVFLPACESGTPEDDVPGAPEERVEPVPEARRRILVADDNLDVLRAISIVLRRQGYDVMTAVDGVQALQKVREQLPQLALLDIGMPRMDGYELARRLRREPRGADMLLIAMTGWGQERDKQRALAAGFDMHLTKPVGPDALMRLFATDLQPPAQGAADGASDSSA